MSGKAQLIGDEMRRPGPPRTARPMRCGRCARRIRTMPRGCSAAFNGQSIARRIAAAAKAAGIEKRIQRAQRPAAGWASPASSPPGGEHHRDDACRRLEDSPHGCALLGRRHGRTGRGRQVPVTADRDDRCRHGAPACAPCRRGARLPARPPAAPRRRGGGSPPGGAGDHPGRGDRRRVLPADQRRGPRSDVAHQGAGVAPPPAAPVTLPAARLSGGSARGLRPSAGSPFRVTRCPQAWPTQPGSRRLSRVMQPRTRLMAPGGPTYTGTAPHTAHRQSSRVVFRLTVPGCADRGGDPGRNRSRPVFAAPVHGVLRRGPDVRVSLSPSAPGDT